MKAKSMSERVAGRIERIAYELSDHGVEGPTAAEIGRNVERLWMAWEKRPAIIDKMAVLCGVE